MLLANRLKQAYQQQQKAIEFVGSATREVGTGTACTITISGISLAEDDVVYAIASCTQSDVTWSASGWTKLADLWQSDTDSCNMCLFRKVMGPSPDSTVPISHDGSNGNLRGVAMAFRGVDTTTPEDVTTVTRDIPNTGVVDPGAITPVTANCAIVLGGASAYASGSSSAYTSPAGYETMVTPSVSVTTQAGMCYQLGMPASAEDPAAFGGGTAATTSSYCAVTIALRPA